MAKIEDLLAGNQEYVSRGVTRPEDPQPARQVAVVTCMDTRIDPLGVLGLALGEAHVLRNAGGRVTDDVVRSLILSVHVLGARTVAVMHHTGCGLANVSEGDLRRTTGADIAFLPITDHEQALREDIARLAVTPHLEPLVAVAGFLFDVVSGRVKEVARWTRGPEGSG
jgi:carbonic anhydrase